MTISERIFELLKVRGMSQKDFADMTGIAQSTISDWKRKKTNPVSEKILVICNALGVSPYELLGGTEGEGNRSAPTQVFIIEKNTEAGKAISDYLSLDKDLQGRLIGYMEALKGLKDIQDTNI